MSWGEMWLALLPLGMIASVARKSIFLPSNLLTCGWYISTVPVERFTWRG
jgi:hypothetical protein